MTKKATIQSAADEAANRKKALQKGSRQKTAAEVKCNPAFQNHTPESGLKKQTERLSELAGYGKDKLICEPDTCQDELQQQNALLSTILDHTDVMLACLDTEFNFIWANAPYAQSCRMALHELVGRNHFDLFPHGENEAIFRRVCESGESVFFKDKPFTYPDQPERGVTYWDWSLVPVKGKNDCVAGLVLSLRETTSFKHMQQELSESEEKFRSIAESSSDIIFQIEADGKMNYVSPALRMLGYTPEDVIGRPFREFVASVDLHKAEAAFQTIKRGKKIQLVAFRLLDADGKMVDFEVSATPIFREGKVVGVQGIARDVSEKILAEEKIKQLARFPAENPFPVMRISQAGIIIYANNASQPLLESWGVNTGELLPEEIRKSVTDVIGSGTIKEIEQSYGETTLALNLVPIYDGNFVNIYGINITDRKRAEDIIRKNEAQLKTTLNNLAEGVIVADLDGNLIYWNPAAIEQFGFSSQKDYLRALQDFKDTFELSTTEDGILPMEKWPVSRILQGESLQNWEVTIRRRDIDWQRIFNIGGTLARDRDSNPIQGILTLTDITERKQVEDKVRLHNAVLNGINTIFLAGMQCESEEELAEETLRVAEHITGSRFGIIGEIGPDGLLHDMVISDPGLEQCAVPEKTGRRKLPGNFRVDGIFGEILNKGKSVIVNDTASHLENIIIPEGHPPLASFLGVPLLHGEKIIGLFGLANREGGYHQEELDSVKALIPAYIEILFKYRAERALQESEKRERTRAIQFKQLLDFTPIPVWIAHDPECRVVTTNMAAARLMGVSPGMNISQDPGPGIETPKLRVFRDGTELDVAELPLHYAVSHGVRIDDVEIELELANSEARRILLGASAPLLDAEGQVQGGISAYIDITERKKLEKKLLQAKQEWEMTFDAVPDMIAILDPEYRIMRVNRAMAERVGMSPHELVGKKCYETIHRTSAPVKNCPYDKTCKDGTEHSLELFEQRMGGYFLVTTSPLLDQNGKITAAIHVARDITEHKKAEAEIKNLNKELQKSLEQLENANINLKRSNEDLQHFASIVSHDLQEPLRTVSSFVQLIEKRYKNRLDDKGHIFMQHIVDGTGHMQTLLSDLLDYSRVGGGKLIRKTVSLENVLKDIKRNLDRRIKENRAEITSSGLPEVYGDEIQLFTLLQNFISNALKYRGPEPPRIHISAKQEKDSWTICVQDNGIGFDPKHAEQIFLIFQRLHLRKEYEGTGIGLAICKKIVERHGGRIWAESEPGNGAAFYFTLPKGNSDEDE